MESIKNINAFYADFESVSSCLSAIYQAEQAGLLDSYTSLLEKLRNMENDSLKKLYIQTIYILAELQSIPPSDSPIQDDYFYGDFEDFDFLFDDFYTGYLDYSNKSYEAIFGSILQLFEVIKSIADRLTNEQLQLLQDAILEFLTDFWEIQREIEALGLQLCTDVSGLSPYNNSDSLYLQAVGSDGHDGIVAGIHLRWMFAGDLADKHLAKGNYFENKPVPNTGYNKKDDFVRIFRAPYRPSNGLQLNLNYHIPAIDHRNRQWTYVFNNSRGTEYVKMTFEDAAQYTIRLRSINPLSQPKEFIDAYNGVIGLEVRGNSFHQVAVQLANLASTQKSIRLEAASANTFTAQENESLINSYQTEILTANENKTIDFIADNIRKIRIKKEIGISIKEIVLHSYASLLQPIQESDWEEIGSGFALSLDDNLVFNNLETAEKMIDHLWPHYNGGTTVRTSNYRNKWNQGTPDDQSIRELVEKYLLLSETDPRAMETLSRINGELDLQEEIKVSNLDTLNMLAMDYHIARMLGLGHIDHTVQPTNTGKYIYQVRYTTKTAGAVQVSEHRYTSLPTSIQDRRTAQNPKIRPLKYGFPAEDSSMDDIVDSNGYSLVAPVRVINIGREKESFEYDNFDFFAENAAVLNANPFTQTKSILYGIEYRKNNNPDYVKPEITQEPGYDGQLYYAYDTDNPNGVLEPVPLLDQEDSLYIHMVRENGIHHYAIYGIDWFFRSSLRSEEASSDETTISLSQRILPPINPSVQYIQEEDPIVFTTDTEQGWTAGRMLQFPDADTSLTRVTFDWVDIVDVSYVDYQDVTELTQVARANQVRPLFLDRTMYEVVGKITRLLEVPDNDQLLRITTGGFTALDGTTAIPVVPTADLPRFANSMLNTAEGSFRVHSLQNTGSGLEITIYKNVEESLISDADPENPMFGKSSSWIIPSAGNKFSVVENLGDANNWQKLEKTVPLVSFADPNQAEIETLVDAEGNANHFWIGGIHQPAQVTSLFGSEIPEEDRLPGYYKVVFPSYTLAEHPQSNIPYNPDTPAANNPETIHNAHVEWYKGIVRMPVSATTTDTTSKEIQVVRIEELSPLELYIYDADYIENPIYVPEVPTATIPVNFHPGYKAYFFTEPSPYIFNRSNILPANGANDRRTLMALQSLDTRKSNLLSTLTMPMVLLARNIVKPQPIEMPSVSSLKVRPDATKRAAFTLDIKVAPIGAGSARSPFGHIFYRTDHNEVLDALYSAQTKQQIVEDLQGLTEDLFYEQRYSELVNLVFDPLNEGHFKMYPAIPTPYRFPIPDKSGLVLPTDSMAIKTEKYRRAIQATLMPLTEQPPLFEYLDEGLLTENALPVLRDTDGKLLDQNDPRFNPYPMARKFKKPNETSTWYVRFTDYTLNGNSRQLYFYSAVEIDNQLTPGPLSPFAGPVEIMQSVPSEAPQIKAFIDNTDVTNDLVPPMISFQIANINIDDRITKIRIYRFEDPEKLDVMMGNTNYVDVALGEYNPEGYWVSEKFDGMAEVPFGKTIYYRLAGIRSIVNENNVAEDILSLPSLPLEVHIVDSKRPLAPEISFNAALTRLEWPPIGKDYSYYLYKMNRVGNWENVYQVVTPASNEPMSYILPHPTNRMDEDGDRIYDRYKLSVESTIGIFNLQDEIITI